VVDVEIVVKVVAVEASCKRRFRSGRSFGLANQSDNFCKESDVGSSDDGDGSELFIFDVDVATANDVIAFFAADERLSVDAFLRRQECVGREPDFRAESKTLRQVEGLRRFDGPEGIDGPAKQINLEKMKF